jgi:GR25 family glycosyltransferase involved in LPS biosynthesis
MQNELPPVHLINLDRSTDRLRRFKQLNGHLTDVIRVPAVECTGSLRGELESSGYIMSDLSYKAGTLGSAMSHVRLWEKAASEGIAVTIFEDAIVVSHRFEEKAREVLSGIPDDWDFIQWGSGFPPGFVWVDFGVSRGRLEPYGPSGLLGIGAREDFQSREFSPAAIRLVHSFGIMGYSISPKGARAALDYCIPLRNRLISFPEAAVSTWDTSIDIAMAGLYPSLKAYICLPPLLFRSTEFASVRTAMDQV